MNSTIALLQEQEGEQRGMIETMTPRQATEQLRALGLKISPETVQRGIEQGKLPFGISITTSRGSPVYLISRKKFNAWVAEWSS